MTEPSVEASLPTRIEVQPSPAMTASVPAAADCPPAVAACPAKRTARTRVRPIGMRRLRFMGSSLFTKVRGSLLGLAQDVEGPDGLVPPFGVGRRDAAAAALFAVIEGEVVVFHPQVVAELPPGVDDALGVVEAEPGNVLRRLPGVPLVEVAGERID